MRQSPHKRCAPVSGLPRFIVVGVWGFVVDLEIALKSYDNETLNEAASTPIRAKSGRASVSLGQSAVPVPWTLVSGVF